MEFKTIYNCRKPSKGTVNELPSMTFQEDKDAADINSIMDKYARCGTLPNISAQEPIYADVSTTPSDYLEAQNIVISANDAFASLPSDIRREFHDDPVAMLEFLSDEKNRSRAIELGLVEAPAVVETPRIVTTVTSEPGVTSE